MIVLPVIFAGYWLHAHGEGGGADFDLVMERDEDGLPVLRARHVAGLLRVALRRAQAWGWFGAEDDGVAELLLGARPGEDGRLEKEGSTPGCLAVGDARISAGLRAALKAPENCALIESIFARVAATAIESRTGVASQGQLRDVEAALPVALEARVHFAPEPRTLWAGRDQDRLERLKKARERWREWLITAWPAFDEAGAKRTRGFGRLRYCAVQEGPGFAATDPR